MSLLVRLKSSTASAGRAAVGVALGVCFAAALLAGAPQGLRPGGRA